MPRSPRSRGWCFTINNPAPFEGENPLAAQLAALAPDYYVYQLEVGEQGTRHFQGYLYKRNKVAFDVVRAALPGCHLEAAKGSPLQNKVYCSKPDGRLGGPWESGELPAQGWRVDLREVARQVLEQPTLEAVARTNPEFLLKYPSGVRSLHRAAGPKPSKYFPRTIFLYYGGTGTGKTYAAVMESDDEFYKKPSGPWFDHYQGEDYAIFDEFMGAASAMRLDDLLTYFDDYRCDVPLKGTTTWWLAKKIVVTTNLHPRAWYKWTNREVSYAALMRRFSGVRWYGQPSEELEADGSPRFLPYTAFSRGSAMMGRFIDNPTEFGYQGSVE